MGGGLFEKTAISLNREIIRDRFLGGGIAVKTMSPKPVPDRLFISTMIPRIKRGCFREICFDESAYFIHCAFKSQIIKIPMVDHGLKGMDIAV